MMLINQAKKKDGEDKHSKWYILYQNKMFRYLRLLDASLCLLYIPLILAYSIDETNGNQSRKTWVWALVITFIGILFVIRAVKDVQTLRNKKRESEEDSRKALVFASKPLNLWSQEEVLLWINIGRCNKNISLVQSESQLLQNLRLLAFMANYYVNLQQTWGNWFSLRGCRTVMLLC